MQSLPTVPKPQPGDRCLEVVSHHDAELVVVNGSAAILVNLLDDVLDVLILDAQLGQSLLKLVMGDLTIAVQVEVLESCLQVLLTVVLAHVNGGCQELLVINCAITIDISLLHTWNVP